MNISSFYISLLQSSSYFEFVVMKTYSFEKETSIDKSKF